MSDGVRVGLVRDLELERYEVKVTEVSENIHQSGGAQNIAGAGGAEGDVA